MVKLTDLDRTPPKSAIKDAQKVLDWKEKYGDEVKGMTQTGWTRARQIASGKPLSLDIIKRISQFERHEKNKTINPKFKDSPWKDNGYVAWLGWGGDSAILTWSKRVIEKTEKKENSILKAESYKARFLEAGVVKYDEEMVLIKPENLMNIADKFKGAYVVIGHKDLSENESDQIVGYISKVWFEDGWAWCDFTVNNEEAINLINNKNYSVSCAYYAKYTVGGTYHNIPYDKEIVDGDAIHLAIVDKPRYEEALILKNSIKNKVMTIFKFKKEEKKENSVETKEIALENAMFEIEEGSTIPVSEMIEAYKNAKEEEKRKEEEEKAKVNADDEFEIDGKMVKVKELASAYKSKIKKNEEDEELAKKEKEEIKVNEEKEKEEEEKEIKKNSKDFEELENARSVIENSSDKKSVKISTDISQFALGKALYGSPQKAIN